MQLSERFRRGVVIPKDDLAEEQLRSRLVSPDTNVEFLSIGDDAFFYQIWSTGLFTKINEACETCIDDYEEVILEPGHLELAIAVVQSSGGSRSPSRDVEEFRDQLVALLQRAREEGRPAVFVL